MLVSTSMAWLISHLSALACTLDDLGCAFNMALGQMVGFQHRPREILGVAWGLNGFYQKRGYKVEKWDYGFSTHPAQ